MFDIKTHRAKASAFATAIADLLAIREPLVTNAKLKTFHVEQKDGNVLTLVAEANDLKADHVRFHRIENHLTIEIIDFSQNLLVHSGLVGGGKEQSDEEIKKEISEFGHLSWSSSGFESITGYLYHLMVKRLAGHEDIWMGRSVAMLNCVLRVLTDLRDAGHETLNEGAFRASLQLDKLIEFSNDERVGDRPKKILMHYLTNLPGFNLKEVLAGNIDPQCYTQHGYLTSIVTGAMNLLLPAPVLRYEYQITAPFKRIKAEVTDRGFEAKVFYHPREELYAA